MRNAQNSESAVTVSLADLAATEAFAARLAAIALPGDVFALIGDLGMGKTAFARSFINARAALDGDLDRIEEIVRIKGYINVDPDFTDVSAALNGASELFIDLFGEPGRHSRTAIGVASMPFGVAIEVEAVLQVR